MKKKLSALIIAVLFVLSLCSCDFSFSDTQSDITPAPSENPPLSVHFIDVGQGDSILLESNGEFVLIDAGETDYGATVVNYIKSQNAETLKYVIATHPHSDHCGGLTKVINKLGCENFITVETDQSTKTWTNVLKAVDKAESNYIDAKVGETYSFGESSFEVLAPLSDYYEGYNNYSVVIKATYKDTSFLLMGDAEKQSEKEMLKANEDLSANVIKIGHHGSSSSSSKEFLKAVNPDYAVISCGKDNDYGHPHKETIQTLSKLSIPYFETDIDGTVVACSDGQNIKFYTEKNGEVAKPTVNETKTKTYDNYIGNKNSKVYHTPDCSGAKSMSEKNKVTFSSKEEAENAGYKPCNQCEP